MVSCTYLKKGSKHKVHINKAMFQAFTVVTLAHSHTLAVGPAESGWVAVHGLVGAGYRQALHCTLRQFQIRSDQRVGGVKCFSRVV